MAFTPANNLAGLRTQRQNILGQIHRRGGRSAAPGYTKRLGDVETQIRSLRNPVTGQPVQGQPQPAQNPYQQAPNAGSAYGNTLNRLFPSMNGQIDPEGSKLYQFQKQQGLRDLERVMSARGLTGSGAEVEANSRFLNELGSAEAERQNRTLQTEADRLFNLTNSEADRRFAGQTNAWDNLYRFSELATRQSPMTEAYDATQRTAGLYGNIGNRRAGMIGNDYARSYGGGGQSPGQFIPPFPNAPDYSIVDRVSAGTNAPNTNSFWSSIFQYGPRILQGL